MLRRRNISIKEAIESYTDGGNGDSVKWGLEFIRFISLLFINLSKLGPSKLKCYTVITITSCILFYLDFIYPQMNIHINVYILQFDVHVIQNANRPNTQASEVEAECSTHNVILLR